MTRAFTAALAIRAWSPARQVLSAVLVLCASFAIVVQARAWQAPVEASISPAPVAAPAAGKVRARNRCDTCGVVQSIRLVDAHGDEPASYKFVIRMRSGITRTSTEPTASRWREGDRVTLIGGHAAAVD